MRQLHPHHVPQQTARTHWKHGLSSVAVVFGSAIKHTHIWMCGSRKVHFGESVFCSLDSCAVWICLCVPLYKREIHDHGHDSVDDDNDNKWVDEALVSYEFAVMWSVRVCEPYDRAMKLKHKTECCVWNKRNEPHRRRRKPRKNPPTTSQREA